MYTLKTTITINRKLAVIGSLILGISLVGLITYALITGTTINYYGVRYTIVLIALVIAFTGLIWANRNNLRSLI